MHRLGETHERVGEDVGAELGAGHRRVERAVTSNARRVRYLSDDG